MVKNQIKYGFFGNYRLGAELQGGDCKYCTKYSRAESSIVESYDVELSGIETFKIDSSASWIGL